jgi:hypothetical protein
MQHYDPIEEIEQVSNSTLSKLLDYKPGQCILSSRGGAKMLAQAAFPYTHKWAGHFHLLFRSPGSRPIFCFNAHERSFSSSQKKRKEF